MTNDKRLIESIDNGEGFRGYRKYLRCESIKSLCNRHYVADKSYSSYKKSKHYNFSSINYTEYLLDNLDKTISYTEYIAENINEEYDISYSDYLAESIDKKYNIKYGN